MYIPYRGYKVTIDKEKWKNLSVMKKLRCICSYIREQSAYLKKRKENDWRGWVSVHVQDIGNTGMTPDPVYEVTIYAGRLWTNGRTAPKGSLSFIWAMGASHSPMYLTAIRGTFWLSS